MSVSLRLATSLEEMLMSSGAGEGSVCCPVLMGSGCAALELGALEARTSSCQEGGGCLGRFCILITYLRNKPHTCKGTTTSGSVVHPYNSLGGFSRWGEENTGILNSSGFSKLAVAFERYMETYDRGCTELQWFVSPQRTRDTTYTHLSIFKSTETITTAG